MNEIINRILCDINTLKYSLLKKIAILFNSSIKTTDVTSLNFTGNAVDVTNTLTDVRVDINQTQADWNESNSESKAFIKNKPEISGGLGYKVYTALLTQTGTDAPIALVLENTLGGDITYTRTNLGQYDIISSNLFGNINQLVVFLGSSKYPVLVGGSNTRIITRYNNSSSINLWSMNSTLSSFVEEFGSIYNLSIEIRVYD